MKIKDKARMELSSWIGEIIFISDLEEEIKGIGNGYDLLNFLKEYGTKGVIKKVTWNSVYLSDYIIKLIDLYQIVTILGPYKSMDTCASNFMADCLEPFITRVKLDNVANELGDYVAPEFCETVTGIINDSLGKTPLMIFDSEHLSVKELSIIWNMTEEAIRNNILAKPEIKSRLTKFGKHIAVPAKLAYEISKQRQGFKATRIPVFKDQNQWLVPINSYGEMFSKECRNSKGYRIGPKGNEELVPDYKDALKKLINMKPKPYWRRKNKNGNWGIVAGVSWVINYIK